MTWPWGHREASWGWPSSWRRFWHSGPQSPWPGAVSSISPWLLTWADALPGSRAGCSSDPRSNFLLRLIILSVEGTLATRRPRVPRQNGNFNVIIKGLNKFTWVQPPFLWSCLALAGHEECWCFDHACVLGLDGTQRVCRGMGDNCPALSHGFLPVDSEHRPDYIKNKMNCLRCII